MFPTKREELAMGRYLKKPIEIEAVRLSPELDVKGLPRLEEDPPAWLVAAVEREAVAFMLGQVRIQTRNGIVSCWPGDWIMCGPHDDIYPCAGPVFDETYELASVARHHLEPHLRWDSTSAPKYHLAIFNTAGELPHAEPVFLVRGRDPFAAPIVRQYAGLVRPVVGQEAAQKLLTLAEEIQDYADKRMPDGEHRGESQT